MSDYAMRITDVEELKSRCLQLGIKIHNMASDIAALRRDLARSADLSAEVARRRENIDQARNNGDGM